MYESLKGKVAIVTGGSMGIGEAIIRRYAEEGMRVVINYRSHPEEAKKLPNRFKIRVAKLLRSKEMSRRKTT